MEDFNAGKARDIVASLHGDELLNILSDIKAKAEQGETVLRIYRIGPLTKKAYEGLVSRGFRVQAHSQVEIQRDGLVYSIYWD